VIGVFPVPDQQSVRSRLSKCFRFIISQRLLPRADGSGRVAAFEILKSTLRTRDYIQKGDGEGKSLLDAMRDGDTDGMRHFDGEIERLIREGIVDLETGLSYASNEGNLRLQLGDLLHPTRDTPSALMHESAAESESEASAEAGTPTEEEETIER
jgi:twitching motility protein PilT